MLGARLFCLSSLSPRSMLNGVSVRWSRAVRYACWMRFLLIVGMGGVLAAQDPRTLRPQQQRTAPAVREIRIALVIGNGAYPEVPLKNPVRDAQSMAKALLACGFQVQVLVDASLPQMEAALRTFGQKLRAGGVGLFFYAGHGMQVKGSNYLIPVGADIADEDEVRFKALDANAVLAKMESAGNGLNLLVLDACRNNPFGRGWRRGGAEGLAQMDAPTGTYIAFATAPGRTASDGMGSNGLYTQHLLESLQQPGLKVEEVFKRVRVGVRRASKDQQVPWDSSSLTGEFYFQPGGVNVPPTSTEVAGINAPVSLPPPDPDSTPGPPPPSAQAGTGNLQVAVVGAEARVFLDSEFRGLAKPDQPLNLTGLSPGAAKLSTEAQGYLSVRQTVQIESGKWRQVALPMKKGVRLVVYRKPNLVQWKGVDFEIHIGGKPLAKIGNREFVSIEIPAETCTLKVLNTVKDMVVGVLETQVRIENSPKVSRFFRVNSGMSLVLTEVSEETCKSDLASFGSQQVDLIQEAAP